MNRIIKFKQPVKGIIIDKVDAHDITLKTHKSKNITWHYWGFIKGRFISPVAGFDSYQFTGSRDRNGKEIYEGDIIDFAGLKPIEIVWKDNGFKSSMFNSEPIYLTQEGLSAIGKIIGNIFENKQNIN